MKRTLFYSTVTGVLATSLFAGPGLVVSAKDEMRSYLVAFQQKLPADYEKIIEDAGGKILRALPKIGGVEAESDDPDFLKKLKGAEGVYAVNVELSAKLDFNRMDPSTADGKPVTDIPQADEVNSYWDYQWDIKRITHDGDSYKIETGGQEKNGKVTHKAVVGVIDSGIDPNHPDLKANLLGGMSFVPAGVDASEEGDSDDILDRGGHGTHVAGSIAGNGKVKGVGPNLGIRVYRVFPESGSAPTAWITDAIIKATDDKVDVINMSIGGFDNISGYTYEGETYKDLADALLWKRAIQYAVDKDVTVVVAAGNESLNLNNPTEITDYMNREYGELGFSFKGASVEVPGQIPGVITVSSSVGWTNDKIAFYSNYGSKSIDVAGPGGDNGPVYEETRDLSTRDFHYRTLSTWPTYLEPYFTSNLKGYALLHGTSMASPKVAGIAGVIKAKNPKLKPSQVAALLKKTATDYGKSGTDPLFGAGEANAFHALK